MITMMPTEEHLDSDRVNYLIWRYLQESNLKETAVKLQSEWQVDEPQRLDFAPHVKHHALVYILQKGLLFNDYERATRDASLPPLPSVFGTVTGPRNVVSPVPEALAEAELQQPQQEEVVATTENGRKRSIDSTHQQQQEQQNGSPVKKPRMSNGYENGLAAAEGVSPMEIDQNGDGHAYPSPKEVDEPVTPILTKGPDEATQFEKVTELIAETTYIDLSFGQQSNNTTLLHCAWSPRDPQILATAGTDALGLLWNMARGASSTTEAGSGTHVNGTLPPHVSLIDENEPRDSKIDAMSWSHDGSSIALAIGRSQDAAIRICKDNGLHIATFNGQTQPIYCLRANPLNKDILVALMPDDNGTGITVSSSSLGAFTTFVINHAEGDDVLDAAWTGDTEFVVCGGDKLQLFSCVEGHIVPGKKFETRESHGLEKVIYDKHSQLLATASQDGTVDIWTTEGMCRSIDAHRGPIKALEWQPLPNTVEKLEAERLLVSAGHDGTIGMWNIAESGPLTPRVTLNLNASAVAAAFTPDGAFLAGATEKVILIWKVDDPSFPRASWTKRSEEDPQSPSVSEDGALEDHYCLCWDMNGQKLAYGANNQLAVINFRR